MVAILASSLENADWISDSLQLYWNRHGIYRSIARFETEAEFVDVITRYQCSRVILAGGQALAPLISQIRGINPTCKIAVITDRCDPKADSEAALICREWGVDSLVTRASLERPLELLSKQLHIV